MAAGHKTGGRQKGTRNKRTIARERAAQELQSAATDMLGQLDQALEDVQALQLMQRLYRMPDAPLEMRFEAAKAALPYESPRIATVTQKHEGEVKVAHRIEIVPVEPRPYPG